GRSGRVAADWLILVSLKRGDHGNQRQIADVIGIEGATLTHHLNRLGTAGLVTRRRDPANRRVHVVELTDAGESLFDGLRRTAVAFDRQLRTGFSDRDVAQLRRLLERLAVNATAPEVE
ncbi:MAG: MarR family winged helix-turn-helix transcriptional regulator, partial [Actinobacteria bacterium]|nr:MarR family winged helix-turn-helix transcriptional regulator [Actinomycetota bacterium]